MNFVLIADVNNFENYHVGDEAMLAANLDCLRELFPQSKFAVISQNPEFTANHYKVDSLPYFGFSLQKDDVSGREKMLAEILSQAVTHLEKPAKTTRQNWEATLDCVRNSDVLIVSGGGNINSNWPHHIYERVALIRVAALFGKPSLLIGQTLSPDFAPQDLALLEATLPLTRLIGVREKPSAELCRSLNIPEAKIAYQLDDAIFFAPTPITPPTGSEILDRLLQEKLPWIAVTLHPFTSLETIEGQAKLKSLARQIKNIALKTGAQPVFIPHVTSSKESGTISDAQVGQDLARLLQPEIIMPVLDMRVAGEVRWLTGQASLVISSRYHPLVFALAARVPAIGIHVDNYTHIKLNGILEHAGLADWLLPVDLAGTNLLTVLTLELWQIRREVSEFLRELENSWKEEHQGHWQKIYDIITGQPDSLTSSRTGAENSEANPLTPGRDLQQKAPKPSSFLVALISELEEWQRGLVAELEISEADRIALRQEQGVKDTYIGSLRKTIEVKELDTNKESAARQQEQVVKDTYINSLKETIEKKDSYINTLARENQNSRQMFAKVENYAKSLEVLQKEIVQKVQSLEIEREMLTSQLAAHTSNSQTRTPYKLGQIGGKILSRLRKFTGLRS